MAEYSFSLSVAIRNVKMVLQADTSNDSWRLMAHFTEHLRGIMGDGSVVPLVWNDYVFDSMMPAVTAILTLAYFEEAMTPARSAKLVELASMLGKLFDSAPGEANKRIIASCIRAMDRAVSSLAAAVPQHAVIVVMDEGPVHVLGTLRRAALCAAAAAYIYLFVYVLGIRTRGTALAGAQETDVDASQLISQKLQLLCAGLGSSKAIQHLAESEFEVGAALYVHAKEVTAKAFGEEHALSFSRMTRSLIGLLGGSGETKGTRVLSKVLSLQALKVRACMARTCSEIV